MDPNLRRLFRIASDKVVTEWGLPAYEKLGARLQRALLGEAVLFIAAQQDALVGAESVRRIVTEGWTWVCEEVDA